MRARCWGQTDRRGARQYPRAFPLNATSAPSLRLPQDTRLITSADNPHVRLARSLARQAHEQLFLCEGIRFLRRASDGGFTIRRAVVAPELIGPAEIALVRLLERERVPVSRVSARLFASISRAPEPGGLAAIVHQRWRALPNHPSGVWIVANDISIPGNLGTIVRTAEAANASGVIVIGATISPFEPAAVRATMGSIFGVPIVASTWAALVGWCRKWQVRLVGTAPRAGVPLRLARLDRPLAVVLGSEQRGLPATHIEDCDLVVSIPMLGPPDSLNVAVAAGVVLYEIVARESYPLP